MSQNCTPLSVSTVWIWYGIALTKAFRKPAATLTLAVLCNWEGDLRRSIHGDEEVQLSLFGTDLGDIYMEVADGGSA